MALKPDTLADDLYRYMVGCLYEPAVLRSRPDVRWVMNLEWLNEVRLLALQLGESMAGDHLFGYPYEIRDDAGVPQLVPYGEPS